MTQAGGIDPANETQSGQAAVRTTHRFLGDGWRGCGHKARTPLEDDADFGDITLAAVIAQNAIMADAHQPQGQEVQTEAADEFAGREGQRFDRSALSVIAIGKGDGAGQFIDRRDASVAEGHAVRVVRQIAERLFGAAERTFGINDPRVFK